MDSACLIPGLLDDVGILCLARVPLCYRFRISGVCRRWRKLFQQETFWDVRLELPCSEPVLLLRPQNPYKRVVLHGFSPTTRTWLKLPPMPDNGRCAFYSTNSSLTFAVIAGKLFAIGGYDVLLEDKRQRRYSSTVSYFDMKSYEWNMAAHLNVPRSGCEAGVIDNQLYVCGGEMKYSEVVDTGPDTDPADCPVNPDVHNAEVYNPVLGTWKFISRMESVKFYGYTHSSIVIDNKFHVLLRDCSGRGYTGTVYDPSTDQWSPMPDGGLQSGWTCRPIIFNGKLCIRREVCTWHPDIGTSCETLVLVYNPSQDAWDLIHGQNALQAYPFRHAQGAAAR